MIETSISNWKAIAQQLNLLLNASTEEESNFNGYTGQKGSLKVIMYLNIPPTAYAWDSLSVYDITHLYSSMLYDEQILACFPFGEFVILLTSHLFRLAMKLATSLWLIIGKNS